MLLSGSWFGAIKTDQGHFPWHPPRYALSGTFKGQSEQKSTGRKKKRLKPHRPADLHSMSLMRFTSSEGGLSFGQKMLSMLTAMTLQSLITFDSAFYLASAVGTDAKSKYYQMNVALSVGMALSGKKTHINFIYICSVLLGHGQGWVFQFRCKLFICIMHTLGWPTLTVTDNKWRSKTLTLYENVQRLWKDTSGFP